MRERELVVGHVMADAVTVLYFHRTKDRTTPHCTVYTRAAELAFKLSIGMAV